LYRRDVRKNNPRVSQTFSLVLAGSICFKARKKYCYTKKGGELGGWRAHAGAPGLSKSVPSSASFSVWRWDAQNRPLNSRTSTFSEE